MALETFDDYMTAAARAHGHMCAGQVLGLRLAIHGLDLLGLDDPLGAHRKRLVTIVEIDRCPTDAIVLVTGCRLGKRSLRFMDFGKVAASFCDLELDRAVRVIARESVRERAQFVRLEFSGGIFADLARSAYAAAKDNRDWLVEFPPAALRVI